MGLLLGLAWTAVALGDVLVLTALLGPFVERLGGMGVVGAIAVAVSVAGVVPLFLGKSVIARLRALGKEPRPARTLFGVALVWSAALTGLCALVAPEPLPRFF